MQYLKELNLLNINACTELISCFEKITSKPISQEKIFSQQIYVPAWNKIRHWIRQWKWDFGKIEVVELFNKSWISDSIFFFSWCSIAPFVIRSPVSAWWMTMVIFIRLPSITTWQHGPQMTPWPILPQWPTSTLCPGSGFTTPQTTILKVIAQMPRHLSFTL